MPTQLWVGAPIVKAGCSQRLALRVVTSLDPGHFDAWFARVDALLALGAFEEAAAGAAEWAEVEGQRSAARALQASVAVRRGRFAEAEQFARESLATEDMAMVQGFKWSILSQALAGLGQNVQAARAQKIGDRLKACWEPEC